MCTFALNCCTLDCSRQSSLCIMLRWYKSYMNNRMFGTVETKSHQNTSCCIHKYHSYTFESRGMSNIKSGEHMLHKNMCRGYTRVGSKRHRRHPDSRKLMLWDSYYGTSVDHRWHMWKDSGMSCNDNRRVYINLLIRRRKSHQGMNMMA